MISRPFFRSFVLLLTIAGLPATAKPAKLRDLEDTVAANPIMTRFAAIITASDLGTFLSSRGPFTLFVPTDAAFSKLPPGTIEMLLLPENKVRLQDILLYHVVNGHQLTAKDLRTLKTILSCQGAPLTVKTSRTGAQFIEKAKIVHADIHCRNGIINEIDTVLMPPESALPPLVVPPPPTPPVVQGIPTNTNAPAQTAPDNATPPPAETNAATVVPVAPEATPAPAPVTNETPIPASPAPSTPTP